MKTIKFITVMVYSPLFYSPAQQAKKAAGTYQGYWSFAPSTNEVANVTASGNDKVNIQIGSIVTNGVAVSFSNNVVNLTYSSSGAPQPGDFTSVTGTVSDKNIYLSYTMYVSPTENEVSAYNGVKQ